MTSLDIAHRRLHNQHISAATFEKAGDVVAWLGAVQAQDYLGSLWAIGLRMQQAGEADIERAVAKRTIIRTWPMRGTLHFVAPADVRWMLKLLTPRVVAGSAQRLLRQYNIDDGTLAHSKEVFLRALQGGKQLTRDAMYQVLEAAHIPTERQRGLQILWRLAQEGVICFGAREGKQPTFVLLDEWVPPAKILQHDEALAELAQRYFTSHGPATLQDFAWWSGLAMADAKVSLEMVASRLEHEVIRDRTYWFSTSMPSAKNRSRTAYLLSNYDEYIVGYRDRSAIFDASRAHTLDPRGNILFSHTLVVNGQVVGAWKRTLKKSSVVITANFVTPPSQADNRAIAAAADRYGAFLQLPIELVS